MKLKLVKATSLDEDRNIVVGAVNIRHYLNEALLLNGGHIGDGVVEQRYWIELAG